MLAKQSYALTFLAPPPKRAPLKLLDGHVAQSLEHPLHTLPRARRHLKDAVPADVVVGGKAPQHVDGDLAVVLGQVALKAAHGVDDGGVVEVVLCFPVPLGESVERVLAVEAADQEDDVGAAIVLPRQGLVALAACRVDDCELWGRGGETWC